MQIQKLLVSLVVSSIVLGCSQPIDPSTSDDLEKLANFSSSLVGLPAETQILANSKTSQNLRVCAYLAGNHYKINSDTRSGKATKLAREQSKAGLALQNYVDALVDASRGESVDQLKAAQAGFQAATTDFFSAAKFDDSVGQIANSAVNLALRAGESSRQSRIRRIMREAIDPLFLLEELLKQDQVQTLEETQEAVAQWERSARCVLKYSRQKSNATSIFVEFNKDADLLYSNVERVRIAPGAIKKLRIAHILAVTNPDSFNDAIGEAVQVLEEVKKIDKARKE